MKVIVWSDFSSPACYVGQIRLQNVVKKLNLQSKIQYESRVYRVDPNAPLKSVETNAEKVAYDKGISLKQAHESFHHWHELGLTEGLDIKYSYAYNTNTMDAHRLVLWVEEDYQNTAVIEKLIDALYKAVLTDNLIIANRDVLLNIVAKIGLDKIKAQEVLKSNSYRNEVINQETRFRDMGESTIPYFVIGKQVLPGIQPKEVFEESLRSNYGEYLNTEL